MVITIYGEDDAGIVCAIMNKLGEYHLNVYAVQGCRYENVKTTMIQFCGEERDLRRFMKSWRRSVNKSRRTGGPIF
jgi:predicted amino acid-binding ACT domain protein